LRLRRSTAREQRQPNSRRGQNPQNLAHSQRSDALYATHPKETKPDGLPEGHGSGRRGGGLPSLVGGTGGARAFNVMPASVTAADPTRSLWQVPGSGVLPDSGALNAKNQGSATPARR
jgi:hypothetical protein